MKNQIVLDFKLVVLRSEHTIWNALVHIFCCNLGSMLFSITVKKNVLNIPYYMFIVQMYSFRIQHNCIFHFYDFSVIYYDFSKLLRGVICPVLESSRGKKSIFIGWGVICSRLGVKSESGNIEFLFLA
jgi:hypothetical protein